MLKLTAGRPAPRVDSVGEVLKVSMEGLLLRGGQRAAQRRTIIYIFGSYCSQKRILYISQILPGHKPGVIKQELLVS